MAQRILKIPPSEPTSLLTTLQELVAPALAMFPGAGTSYGSSLSEASGPRNAGIQLSATPSCSQPEHMNSDKELVSGTSLLRGIMKIASQSLAPGNVIQFSAAGGRSRIYGGPYVAQTLSWNNPERDSKFLMTELYEGFGPSLRRVKITVLNGMISMRYGTERIFTNERKTAEHSIKYAIQAARRQRLLGLERQLIVHYRRSHRYSKYQQGEIERLLPRRIEVNQHENAAKAKLIDEAMSKAFGGFRQGLRLHNVTSTDWGKKLTEELVHLWLEKSLCTARRAALEVHLDHPFLSSSAKVEEWPLIIQAYICSQLREHAIRSDSPKHVTIRMIKERNDEFLAGPPSKDACVMVASGGMGGCWISISDAVGPGKRRIVICQSSKFHTALSDFLRTTNIDKFKSLEGYKGADNANSQSEALDLSSSCAQAMTEVISDASGSATSSCSQVELMDCDEERVSGKSENLLDLWLKSKEDQVAFQFPPSLENTLSDSQEGLTQSGLKIKEYIFATLKAHKFSKPLDIRMSREWNHGFLSRSETSEDSLPLQARSPSLYNWLSILNEEKSGALVFPADQFETLVPNLAKMFDHGNGLDSKPGHLANLHHSV